MNNNNKEIKHSISIHHGGDIRLLILPLHLFDEYTSIDITNPNRMRNSLHTPVVDNQK